MNGFITLRGPIHALRSETLYTLCGRRVKESFRTMTPPQCKTCLRIMRGQQ